MFIQKIVCFTYFFMNHHYRKYKCFKKSEKTISYRSHSNNVYENKDIINIVKIQYLQSGILVVLLGLYNNYLCLMCSILSRVTVSLLSIINEFKLFTFSISPL